MCIAYIYHYMYYQGWANFRRNYIKLLKQKAKKHIILQRIIALLHAYTLLHLYNHVFGWRTIYKTLAGRVLK